MIINVMFEKMVNKNNNNFTLPNINIKNILKRKEIP
jgi:hypothetical protein